MKRVKEVRIEEDSIGEKEVPVDAYYGVHSLRGKENFSITGQLLNKQLIRALAMVKKACAIANFKAGMMDENIKNAIVEASDEIIAGKNLRAFITDPIQGGAGTTANMNANEVIANRANEILGGKLGAYDKVHPNDHVNMAQSTNDVFPTAGKIAALFLIKTMLSELEKISESFYKKGVEFNDLIKMGRTQLQDAVPIRLGQEFHAYASVLERDYKRIKSTKESIEVVNMGASAIGTGINVDKKYFKTIVPELSIVTGLNLVQAEDLIDQTQNLDGFVEMSGALKTCAVNLSKISNDLRLMSSGPKTMVGDINLPPRQNGSSIMPGKVNPVIPEVVNQVAYKVIGNDLTVSMAAEGGQMELNAFEPVLLFSLYESIQILTNAMHTLRINCVDGITANEDKMKKDVENSIGIITALVPHLGYEVSARIAKISMRTNTPIRDLVLAEDLLTEEALDEILNPWTMTKPGVSGKELIEENNI